MIISVLVFSAASAQPATDSAGVLQAANDYIEGFYFGDTAKIYRSIDTTASKHGYYRTADAPAYRKIPMSFPQMLQYAKNERNRVNAERAAIRQVQVMDLQDKIAAVKVRAWWGIDYLLLTKMNDKWVVEKVLWQSK